MQSKMTWVVSNVYHIYLALKYIFFLKRAAQISETRED